MSDRKESPADARLRRERRDVSRLEQEPLRRALLNAIAEGSSTPTEMAELVEARKESVSRKLTELREEGLVEAGKDRDDRRRSLYVLTPYGETELSRHRAFGEAAPPPHPPSEEEASRFLHSALRSAVSMRRRVNRLQDAVDRLRVILEQAERIGDAELALEALAELATTLRQDRQAAELKSLLRRLDEIVLGGAGVGPELVLPAAAHLEYARGRLGDLGGVNVRSRADHLTSAVNLYDLLAQSADAVAPKRADWRERKAWGIVSLAGNLRRQSDFEGALRRAALAMKIFDELEDPYGRSHCFFTFGFCMRLLGDYDEAWACLDEAYKIADANSFQRVRADSLMQMGEVRRCQGHAEEARMLLNEALGEADSLGLLVTQAFAQSAMGAVDYQERRFGDAQGALEIAQELFERCKHVEGIALNARRQAIAARALADRGPGTRAVANLIRRAYTRYVQLHSPAGIAACEIEQGRLQMTRPRGQVAPVLKKLKKLLADNHKREILELDPWVPRVLRDFAGEVGDEQLQPRSEEILASARDKLADKAARGAKSVAEVIGHIQTEKDGKENVLAIEMGGEARRDEAEFALSAAD